MYKPFILYCFDRYDYENEFGFSIDYDSMTLDLKASEFDDLILLLSDILKNQQNYIENYKNKIKSMIDQVYDKNLPSELNMELLAKKILHYKEGNLE